MSEERLALWSDTLGLEEGSNVEHVERLRASYRAVRARAVILAQRIAFDLPGFTVHDIRHVEAVWRMADRVHGEMRLNPVEAYVFGVAVLIHDLGMGVAAYPGGMDDIRADPRWADEVALGLREAAFDRDCPDRSAVERRATETVLRERHADHAAQLAETHWDGPSGPEYLIDDSGLRYALGSVIGRIAASHGASVDALRREFPSALGAPAEMPSDWHIDALGVGALLRVADAANTDASRAPSFDRAIQRPEGIAVEHWGFQQLLAQPVVHAGRLTFTSTRPFRPGESSAWWLAYETLRMVDAECLSVDNLLRDLQHERLAVSGVSGAETPGRLARFVAVEGWTPVDASVHVGDVGALVQSLGGENLYGADPRVALRELLQNASDAVRARRCLEDLRDGEGEILVALRREDEEWSLSVADDGVGMSEHVLLHGLLDFGRSFWDTSLMVREFPGLAAAGYRSAGRYGIGFYSIFMLSDRVRLTTRTLAEGAAATRVLEFGSGIRGRPILRPASSQEQRGGAGTTVVIRLREDPYGHEGLLSLEQESLSLAEVCGLIFPASEIDIVCEEDGERRRVCKAGDWRSIPGVDLVSRATGRHLKARLQRMHDALQTERELDPSTSEVVGHLHLAQRAIQRHMREICDEHGQIVGRAAVVPAMYDFEESGVGALCVGGLRAAGIPGAIAGVILGEPLRASRDAAIPLAGPGSLADWASDQARLIEAVPAPAATKVKCAATIRALGGDIGTLPVCQGSEGWLNQAQLRGMELPDEVVLVMPSLLSDEFADRGPVTLYRHVFAAEMLMDVAAELRGVSPYETGDPLFGPSEGPLDRGSLAGAAALAICESWGCTLEDAFNGEGQPDPDDALTVGVADDKPVRVIETLVLRRPNA